MASDLELLVRDKYDGDASRVSEEDTTRLAAGEPLAYVIGWQPFLGLRIGLDSKPLIPRPETEWWTELLIAHLREKFGDQPLAFLDLCAGSGAIGLSLLKSFPNARVSFGELKAEHCEQIRKNIELNGLDAARADIRESDLFAAFLQADGAPMRFDVIATNPPYIPENRELDDSVAKYEPHEALFSGSDGLDLITRIANEAGAHLVSGGELWMECDSSNARSAQQLLADAGATRARLLDDLYGRPRLLVAYYGQ